MTDIRDNIRCRSYKLRDFCCGDDEVRDEIRNVCGIYGNEDEKSEGCICREKSFKDNGQTQIKGDSQRENLLSGKNYENSSNESNGIGSCLHGVLGKSIGRNKMAGFFRKSEQSSTMNTDEGENKQKRCGNCLFKFKNLSRQQIYEAS